MKYTKSVFLIRKKECNFMSTIITDIKRLLVDCCACPNPQTSGKTVSNTLEYDTIAAEDETVILTAEGFIIYLYGKAYNEPYPTINLTEIQKFRIYEIYDALKIPRPVL